MKRNYSLLEHILQLYLKFIKMSNEDYELYHMPHFLLIVKILCVKYFFHGSPVFQILTYHMGLGFEICDVNDLCPRGMN